MYYNYLFVNTLVINAFFLKTTGIITLSNESIIKKVYEIHSLYI